MIYLIFIVMLCSNVCASDMKTVDGTKYVVIHSKEAPNAKDGCVVYREQTGGYNLICPAVRGFVVISSVSD